MANDLPPLPNDLVEAIGAYWDTGYEEGKCGIGGDAANECLAAVYERVRDYARAAVQAERERVLSIVLMAPFVSEHADEVDDDIKAFAFDLGTLIRKGEPAQQASPQADLFGAPHE